MLAKQRTLRTSSMSQQWPFELAAGVPSASDSSATFGMSAAGEGTSFPVRSGGEALSLASKLYQQTETEILFVSPLPVIRTPWLPRTLTP